MNKLNYIKNFLTLVQVSVLVAGLIGFFLVFNMENGTYVDLLNPHFEFEHGRNLLQSELTNFLNSESSMKYSGPESVVLEVSRISLATEVTTGWKWGMITFIALYSAIVLGTFHFVKKIISNIANQQSFSYRNIQHIKLLGVVLLCIPLLEWVFDWLILQYYSTQYSMKYMNLESSGSFDWSLFNISLLIYTLGFAFDQGRKLQEENELTV
ncbi:DUF2975 domain-containing protein [Marinoscillum sp.]|uniref:DUF2975 domain-containing protein n=1 Tax=Marinoscillum sp. TaxID=2024838 RepID=UPI003BAD339D